MWDVKQVVAEMTGKVFLVGAGPGDPELITLKAINALKVADVVLVDDLVSAEILTHCPQARVVNVGKRGGCKSTPQNFINRMLISLAENGEKVVRLKGGDPFLFGRGGEEMLALKAAGINYEVISGVTSGIAVPASMGIPVTHRAFTHGVTMVTGHTQDDDAVNWKALVAAKTTLVIYMGITKVSEIVRQLLAAGMEQDMPSIAIQHGTLQTERHVISPLAMLPMAVHQEKLTSPAIIVIGDVVRLANTRNLLATLEVAA
jgi:uroporphyrin-III C-methyltransferase